MRSRETWVYMPADDFVNLAVYIHFSGQKIQEHLSDSQRT
jgi:hypothetical protein